MSVVHRWGVPLPLMSLGTARSVAAGAASAQSAALTSNAVRLTPTVPCFVEVGANPTATASSHYLLGGVPVDIAVTPGQKIAAIQVATAGTVYLTEWL